MHSKRYQKFIFYTNWTLVVHPSGRIKINLSLPFAVDFYRLSNQLKNTIVQNAEVGIVQLIWHDYAVVGVEINPRTAVKPISVGGHNYS